MDDRAGNSRDHSGRERDDDVTEHRLSGTSVSPIPATDSWPLSPFGNIVIPSYITLQVHERPSKALVWIIIGGEVDERLSTAKAKAKGLAGLASPVAFVPSLSTRTTVARSRVLGSSAPMGTSRKAQMDRMVRSSLLHEEGSGDRGIL